MAYILEDGKICFYQTDINQHLGTFESYKDE